MSEQSHVVRKGIARRDKTRGDRWTGIEFPRKRKRKEGRQERGTDSECEAGAQVDADEWRRKQRDRRRRERERKRDKLTAAREESDVDVLEDLWSDQSVRTVLPRGASQEWHSDSSSGRKREMAREKRLCYSRDVRQGEAAGLSH